jgi:hypothetical protein
MSKEQAAEEEYRNKSVNNQRGASIEVNNTTDKEGIKISQYSGSNLKIENLVTSELAVNNKQTKVNNDSFETVLNNKCVWTGKDSVNRVVENTYDLRGFSTEDEINAAREWKETYRPIAEQNSEFEILRGGQSFPGEVATQYAGARDDNPTMNQERKVIDDEAPILGRPATVNSLLDEVTDYAPVDVIEIIPETGVLYKKTPSEEDIESGSGDGELSERPASNAVGVVEYGPTENAATEHGIWAPNPSHQTLPADILAIQPKLIPIEQRMGNGGDVEEYTYRNKLEVVGATTNDYPSVRIDPEGRSHPAEVTVGIEAAYVNVDSTPHVEEVNNDASFPVGNHTLSVGNKYNVLVGSGGVQIKTSGAVEIGGTTFKVSAHKIHIQSSAGVNVSSENIVELQSEKNIALRSGRQILIEPGLGVRDNVIVGGATYTEGETYLHHVTAPVEIQQTEETEVYGELVAGLVIGKDSLGGDVKAVAAVDQIKCYPHSHHFKNLPLRLTDSSNSVREIAQGEGINVSDYQTAARGAAHELKQPTNWEQEKENQPEAIPPEEA